MATDIVREVLQDIRTPLYKNAIFLIFNTILVAGAGFLFWFVIARIYPVPEVGQALVLVSIASFLAVLSQLGFGIGLIRFLPRTKSDKGKMINSCLTISTIISLVLAVGILITIDVWFPGWRGFSLWALVPIFFLLVPMMVNAPIVDNTFVAGRRALFVLVRNSLYQSVRLVTPLILVVLLGVLGVLASLVFAHAVALSVAFFLLLPRLYPGFRPGPAIDRTVLNDIFHFSLGNHVGEVLHALPYPVILIIVSRFFGGAEHAAFFGIPWLIASLLFAVPLMASISLYAEGSHFEDRLYGDIRRIMRFMIPLLAVGILFIWFLGDWVLSLFGPSYAAEGFGLLRILAVSGIFVAANGLFLSVARVKKWVKAIIVLMAYVALGTIVLSYFLIPILGLEGAGVAWLIANGTSASVVVAISLLKMRSHGRSLAAEA
ncbi:MAG: lipopolysaccharide biosynthesis protein [Thermoplasmata archaeon]